MATLERTYTIPLRREFLKASKYKRTKKAAIALREFLARHMKSENVKVGTSVNIELWKHGIRNPPSRIKVNATKDDKGVVRAELFGAKPSRSESEKKKAEKTTEKPAEKSPEKKPEENKESKQPAKEAKTEKKS